MTGSSFLSGQLARIAWLDGGQEGLNGALACAFTIRNRVRSGWYNGSWSEVLSNHKKWSSDSTPLPDTIPDPNNYGFQRLLQEIDGVFNGATDDNITIAGDPISKYMRVGNTRPGELTVAASKPVVLYYGYPAQINSPWFQANITNNPDHKMLASVGTLFFWS